MNGKNKNVIIVGAGIAGLTCAGLLSRVGEKVLLVEKEATVGGLARSFTYGDYTFDIGPHRFYTDMPDVLKFIREILGDDLITIKRESGVWMFDRYFDWPLRLSSVFKLPMSVLLSVFRDLVMKKKYSEREESFEGYIKSHYGETLYKTFFKPYTEKFLKRRCVDISRDWAVTGIDRAIIDESIRATNIFTLAKSVISGRPAIDFIYPRTGGIGVFSEKLSKNVIASKGKVLTGATVEEIVTDGGTVKEVIIGGRTYKCDILVWTGPTGDLLRLLGHEKENLEYLSLVLYNYLLQHEPLLNYQWCYYSSDDIVFNRLSIPTLFNPFLAPEGRSGICAEVTCNRGDPIWKDPGDTEPRIRETLLSLNLIRDESSINGLKIERIANVYPVYTLHYGSRYKEVSDLVSSYRNIKLLGRTGTYWYNNMDHSIKAAFELCESLGYTSLF